MPYANVCEDCGDDIDMTDVEGHYSGQCPKCLKKWYVAHTTPDERKRDAEEQAAENIASDFGRRW